MRNTIEDLICDSEVAWDLDEDREREAEKLMEMIEMELDWIEGKFWRLFFLHSAGEVPELIRNIEEHISGFHYFWEETFRKWKAENGTKKPSTENVDG